MAKQIFQGEVQFVDENGAPYAAGTVDFYVPGGAVRKNTWKDAAETQANTNPIVLDAAGRAIIWGVGSYRQVLTDANGVQIWDQIVTEWPDTQELTIPCSATGKNTIVLTPNAALQDINLVHGTLQNGQAVEWVQQTTNDATAVFINFDGKGPLPVYLDDTPGPTATIGTGYVVAGNCFVAYFDQALNGGNGGWHLGGPGLYGAIVSQLTTLLARIVALEALRITFFFTGASGDHGPWAWLNIPISPAVAGGPANLVLLWGSENNIAAGENRVIPLPITYGTNGYIITLGASGADATPMFETNTKGTAVFTLSSRSTGVEHCEFMLIGAL